MNMDKFLSFPMFLSGILLQQWKITNMVTYNKPKFLTHKNHGIVNQFAIQVT